MRTIDDHTDDYKAKNKMIAPDQSEELEASVDDWLKMIDILKSLKTGRPETNCVNSPKENLLTITSVI